MPDPGIGSRGTDSSARSLHICHVNAQSVFAHLDEFRCHFGKGEHHIIAVSETWFKEYMSNEVLSLDGYDLLHRDRNGRGGGGVAFYYLKSIKARLVSASSESYCNKPEFILAEFSFADVSKLLVGVVYRPPRVGFLCDFENDFIRASSRYKHAIVLGDFNADLLADGFDASYLRDMFHRVGLSLVRYDATHHTATSHTWLDVCAVSAIDRVASSGQLAVPFLSGHDLIFIKYKIQVTSLASTRSFQYRDFSCVDPADCRELFASLDWESYHYCQDINKKTEILNGNILLAVESLVPLRSVSTRRHPAPWITRDIRRDIRERNRLHDRARKSGDSCAHALYRERRNEVQLRIRASRMCYYDDKFRSCVRPAQMWGLLRGLGQLKSRVAAASDFDLNELNAHFVSFQAASSLLPPTRESVVAADPEGIDDQFFFEHITPRELERCVASFSSNAGGVDRINLRTLKFCMSAALLPIVDLLNFSLMYSVVPQTWKRSLIVPIKKVPNPAAPSDFRLFRYCVLSPKFWRN